MVTPALFVVRLNKTGWLKMSESQWQKQGATLSHKNACKEFCLTLDVQVFNS